MSSLSTTPAAIAQFLMEEHRPSIAAHMPDMSGDQVIDSIHNALTERFPGIGPDQILQGLEVFIEIDRADQAFRRRA